jgi:hypothetical protein
LGPALLLTGRWQEAHPRARLKSHCTHQLTPFWAMRPDVPTVFNVRSRVCQLVTEYLSMIDGRREKNRTDLNASIAECKASD